MHIAECLRDFGKDRRGNVAIIAALSIIPVLSIAGFAIDVQMTTTQKNKVQNVIDSAVIAGSKAMQAGKSRAEISQEVNQYVGALLANEGEGTVCGQVSLSYADASQDINAAISCYQKTTLSQIMGKDRINFNVSSGTTYGIGKLDVAFVFDLSGSMNSGGRLDDLKSAAEDAIDVLLPPGETPTGDVRISIATYNHSVNAGQYFDKVTQEVKRASVLQPLIVASKAAEDNVGLVQIDPQYDERFFDYEASVCALSSGKGKGKGKGKGNSTCLGYSTFTARSYFSSTCVYNRRGDEAFTDADPSPTSNGHGSDPVFAGHPLWAFDSDEDDKLDGQDEIEDQKAYLRTAEFGPTTPRSWNDGSGNMSSKGALTAGVRFDGNINDGFKIDACRPNNEPQPLTSDANKLKKFVNDMEADGGTAGHLGVAWGWYLLSPNWNKVWPSASKPMDYDEPDSTKVLIMMTDGEFNSTFPLETQSSTEMAAQYCDNIKKDTNIVIFTVGFKVPGGVEKVRDTGKTIVEYCASGSNYAFNANSSEQLTEAYVGIAQSISDLRITR